MPTSDSSRPDDPQALLDYLAEREIPCPSYGYNLRGLTSPSCPECGNRLELKVGLSEVYLKAWIASLASLALAAGVGLLVWLAILQEGLAIFDYLDVHEGLAILGFAVSPLLAAAVLIFRRKYLGLQKEAQNTLTVLSILWSGALFFLFIIIVT